MLFPSRRFLTWCSWDRDVYKRQEALREAIPSFNPEGLDRYLADEKAETNTQGKSIIESIEKTLQKIVLDELKSEMPEGEDWWILGVPKPVRQKVIQKYEENDHQRGGYEYYFELVDYSKIALHKMCIRDRGKVADLGLGQFGVVGEVESLQGRLCREVGRLQPALHT